MIGFMRMAIGGGDQDYTKIAMHLGIALLAVPMVLEMFMESLFALADVFFVARLGPDAVAAVGLTEALMIIVYALGVGFGMPATALVSRRIGERDPGAAAVAAVQVNIIGIILAVAIGINGYFLAPMLLEVMGASAAVVEIGADYASLMLASNVVIILLFINGAVLRGAGDAATAMWALWIANGINLILDPCLLFGWGPFPELGLYGAAVATTIGRGTGALYMLIRLSRGSGRLKIGWEHLRLRFNVMAKLLRLSIGAIGQNLVETASWLLLVRIVAIFGSTVLAGYTIAVRVLMFALMPGWGLANAAATLVGQNLGAKQPERADRSVWWCGLYNTIFLLGFGVAMIVFSESIIGAFTPEPEVVRIGAACLRTITYGLIAYGWGMVGIQAFNGAGDTLTPLWLNIGCFWIIKLPLAYFLAETVGWGPDGIWIAVTGSYTIQAVAVMALFRRGSWKRREV
jgi:putative MATE family efflux protein